MFRRAALVIAAMTMMILRGEPVARADPTQQRNTGSEIPGNATTHRPMTPKCVVPAPVDPIMGGESGLSTPVARAEGHTLPVVRPESGFATALT